MRLVGFEQSLTEQAHKDRVNVNTIMRKVKAGAMVPVNAGTGMYGDFSGLDDYHALQNRLLMAEAQFMSLPAQIRKRFEHDAGKLIAFVQNPENRQECYELGLLIDPNKPEPLKVGDPVPDPPAPEDPPAG